MWPEGLRLETGWLAPAEGVGATSAQSGIAPERPTLEIAEVCSASRAPAVGPADAEEGAEGQPGETVRGVGLGAAPDGPDVSIGEA